MSFREIIRILPVRKEYYLHIHPLLEDHIRSSEGRMYSGAVAIIDDGDVVGELMYKPDLILRKRCSA